MSQSLRVSDRRWKTRSIPSELHRKRPEKSTHICTRVARRGPATFPCLRGRGGARTRAASCQCHPRRSRTPFPHHFHAIFIPLSHRFRVHPFVRSGSLSMRCFTVCVKTPVWKQLLSIYRLLQLLNGVQGKLLKTLKFSLVLRLAGSSGGETGSSGGEFLATPRPPGLMVSRRGVLLRSIRERPFDLN